MILVADSGSTKADWIAGTAGSALKEFNTKGFNPFFHDRDFILQELNSHEDLQGIKNQISVVYFFGAGCSSTERNKIVADSLREFFNNAMVTVEHDMLGSALAVCNGNPGMACILGTGSNICFFDGKNISETRHGLGYIIGDEGSGSYYGKKLLAWYLYGLLPGDIHSDFRNRYQLDKEKIVQRVYREPNVNVFLASFAPFLTEHRDHPFILELLHAGMTEFFNTNVLSYAESKSYPVHFVGSIAWYFKEMLFRVAKEKNIIVGNIIRKPVTGLADYFLNGGKMP